jgi:two-component system OmpR family response regulator
MKILLVEDDYEFAELIQGYLQTKGIKVDICDDPFRALVSDLKKYSLVLLDLGLPGLDGTEVCKDIRKHSKIPIIISSARGNVSDKVLGLQLGADDYLPKPYDPDELYARIISLIRRSSDNFTQAPIKRRFEINNSNTDVLFDGVALLLTEAEFEVMQTLIKNYETVVSKEQLYGSCPSIISTYGKSLEAIISKIRAKLKNYSDANHILSLRNRGYRIVE